MTDRPTPFPNSYDDLVFDAEGWSQTIIVDGKRPDWMLDDDKIMTTIGPAAGAYSSNKIPAWWLAIRVLRRKPKRETVQCTISVPRRGIDHYATIDLIDGKPDLSTIKIAEDAQ